MAIGDAWADGAWVDEGWAADAWLEGAGEVAQRWIRDFCGITKARADKKRGLGGIGDF